MNRKSFRYASLAMNLLEKLLGTRFTISGIEKIPNQPVMFVANHFTRSETFFVPYIINKATGRHIRCLADSKIFSGIFGKFLTSVGTVSTKDPNRDNIIIEDLVSGAFDWMIYPEGSMIKNKEIKYNGLYINSTPYRVGPVRTGASVLALKSELFRTEIVEAYQNNDQQTLDNYKINNGLTYHDSYKDLQTKIVPVNITYYPIRPGDNKIKALAAVLIKNLPKQIVEELEIEGNILLDADINISFGDPINLAEYIKATRTIINKIPIIKGETKNNFILKYFRSRLTSDFMEKIYSDVQINFDHIFVSALVHSPHSKITINHLKRIIYYSAILIAKTKKYRLNSSIFEENIFKIFSDEDCFEFDGVFNLAIKQNLIKKISDNEIEIFKNLLNKEYDFHQIRIENTLQVILREFALLENANSVVKRVCSTNENDLKEIVFKNIYEADLKIFEKNYSENFDKNFSKNKSIGSPNFLNNDIKLPTKIQNLGVVLVHGYKSAPKEVEELAKFLNGYGIKTYSVRLKGHGTAPIDIKNYSWFDWYESMQRGYCALSNICSHVAIVGFSTGGLLSLLSASQKKSFNNLAGVVSINSALKLRDIKSKMIPGINLWNELLEKFNLEKGRMEFIEDIPENPDINYSRNYIKGVYELEKLMILCDDNLHKILCPTLVIQSKNDPVVNPISGKIIFDKIQSKTKKIIEMDFENHVIITAKNKEMVFQEIINFFNQQKII
jgi:esterase/lipase/1-acyl-sn-glycerol-3-phosphate acyltransferase